jgi:hypothetical protein
MEIGSALETAAIELRLLTPTAVVLGGLLAGAGVASVCKWASSLLPSREALTATRTFVVLFLVQSCIYAFHQFTEARLLPNSDALHAATEPYGPDGAYGVHLSDFLVLAPFLAAAITFGRFRARASRLPIRRLAISGVALGSLALIGVQGTDSGPRRDRSPASQEEVAAITGRPHILFRDLSQTGHFGMLSLAPLEAPDSKRVATQLACDRVSFGGRHGVCLRTVPGIFFNYTAAVLDAALKPFASFRLEGRPSRTRTSKDGRLGAVTVFVFGDKYAAPFSTRTTLVDMSNGDVIGDLEKFTTWRNGERFSAADFNFWGVTFAADNNTFYASLGTGGSVYLVRGELGLRKLTVLRDNVECPSLSPDNRLLAFKKRSGTRAGQWRLAVLDLNTMNEHVILGETRSIDDQVEWLDAAHVLYAAPGGTGSVADVWVAAIDGSSPARVFLSNAESPIVVR